MNSINQPGVCLDTPSSDTAPQTVGSRWVWTSVFGDVLIEVRSGRVYFNGDFVEPTARQPIAERSVRR